MQKEWVSLMEALDNTSGHLPLQQVCPTVPAVVLPHRHHSLVTTTFARLVTHQLSVISTWMTLSGTEKAVLVESAVPSTTRHGFKRRYLCRPPTALKRGCVATSTSVMRIFLFSWLKYTLSDVTSRNMIRVPYIDKISMTVLCSVETLHVCCVHLVCLTLIIHNQLAILAIGWVIATCSSEA